MKEPNLYNIEKKWQNKWEKDKVFEVNEKSHKKKYYCLGMFPYPSGSGLHMGHALMYTIPDIYARFKIMNNFNVLHPIGYDSLGLPAENAAILAKTHPKEYTSRSIKKFTEQLKMLGISYDWSRVLSTADPEYYKWDQWIFLKMYEKNLAYQKESPVNWCPKCKTILANEQVQDGVCWRHEDTKIEIKNLKQWFLKITEYADELYEGIDNLDWPDKTKAMQKNWIGKSRGTQINFKINNKNWSIFTTRPDTLFGVTFLVISTQHPRLNELVKEEQKKEVKEFLEKLKSVSEKNLSGMEKEGVFTGTYTENPANGEKIPIYAGNFVLADYGSGIIMAVPAHDQRDLEFAKKYGIRIKRVIQGPLTSDKAHTGEGKLINSKEFSGLNSKDAISKITKWLSSKKIGKAVTNFKLRDWSIARQRYWGAPIPIIHCSSCGTVPVPESELPVKLPEKVEFGKGNPLQTNKEWLNVKCPKCKGDAKREPSTLDTFANSSWYFLRYCDSKNNSKIFDKKKVNYWCPIDIYIGGAEHACMHLIYFRFYTKFLRDLGLIKFSEPAKHLFHQGMIHGEDGNKMSKSLGNVVDPLDAFQKYGVDATRFFLVSVANTDKDFNWSEKEINGSLKFIKKILDYFSNPKKANDSPKVLERLNNTILTVTDYYQNFQYRKATIKLRKLFETISKEGASKNTQEKFLQLLNPICPHITEELWEKLGNKKLISSSEWPKTKKKEKVPQAEDLNKKIIKNIKELLNKIKEKDSITKIYLYTMPFELNKINIKKISKETGKEVTSFAVNDTKKYDPKAKTKKSKPKMPSIYLE